MTWQPVRSDERYSSLDLLRGFALFGVLIINLLYFFRLSLWDHILRHHSHPGWANHAVDAIAATLVEFKAFDLFAFTFGIGMMIQAERARKRGVSAEVFLLRRFIILLAIGSFHMLLIANVDILMLYAVCGLLLIIVLRLPATALAMAGLAAIYLPTLLPLGPTLPAESVLRQWAADATRIYGHGNFAIIVAFRWRETRDLIAPVLAESAQNTAGMMMLGMAAWRFGIIRAPERFRVQLWIFAACAGTAGLLGWLGSHVPLALAYAAILLASGVSPATSKWTGPVAAAGQMALTSYLAQSIVFGLIFYGYGGGLFGQLATAPVAIFGIAFYIAQLFFSQWWLSRYRFGPFEWIWRSLTYGRRQPMSLNPTPQER